MVVIIQVYQNHDTRSVAQMARVRRSERRGRRFESCHSDNGL